MNYFGNIVFIYIYIYIFFFLHRAVEFRDARSLFELHY